MPAVVFSIMFIDHSIIIVISFDRWQHHIANDAASAQVLREGVGGVGSKVTINKILIIGLFINI